MKNIYKHTLSTKKLLVYVQELIKNMNKDIILITNNDIIQYLTFFPFYFYKARLDEIAIKRNTEGYKLPTPDLSILFLKKIN